MRYFITYGDHNYTQSAQRLAQEAQATRLFDCVQTYSPADLPDHIKQHPLMQYTRGGGYWYWKPYLIHNCLSQMQDGDILVYADSGCSIRPSSEWQRFFKDLSSKSIVLFRLGYKNKLYCKHSLLAYASATEPHWGEYRQVLGGVMLLRKSPASCQLIGEWLRLMTEHPEFVTDVSPEERSAEPAYFREHRHDQCILNACLYRFRKDICIHWENLERVNPFRPQAFIASRISDRDPNHRASRLTVRKFLTRTFLGRPMFQLEQYYWEKKR